MAQPAAKPDPKAVRVFVPDSCTQGGELACHATWKGVEVKEIHVDCPASLELAACFNAQHKAGRGSLRLSTFEVPGYVGLVFKVQVLPEARTSLNMTFRAVMKDGRSEEQSFSVVVFRPLVEAEVVKVADASQLSGRIITRNLGFGTSIVKVIVSETSGVKLEKPPGMKEFQDGFRADLAARIPRLVELHANHTKLLQPLAEILAAELDITDSDRMQEVRTFFEDLGEAMTEDQGMESDVVDAIIGALMNNTKGSTYFEKALEYLQSMATDNVILLNPLDTVVVSPGNHEMKVELAVTDRSYNPYPMIRLDAFAVGSKGASRTPIHALFKQEARK